ncbi:MAG: sensor histidine kinase [Gemmobacter sp.]
MAIPFADPWSDLSLAGQFAVAGGVVLAVAAVVAGFFVSGRIEDAVVRNTATSTALYMDSFVAPLTQELATRPYLSAASRAEIGRLLSDTALGQRVVSFKIWREDGLLVDASNAALVGRRFPPTDNLARAWTGEVRADFNDTGDVEDVAEHALGLPLLEIYAPIRDRRTGQVIAVAEFYEVGTQLLVDLVRVRRLAWGMVGAAVAVIGATLFLIVLRGSRTIDRQMAALKELANRNVTLRLRVQGAAARSSAVNDQSLRRIGADLHDGPAQLMAYAALRLEALRGQVAGGSAQAVVDEIDRAVKDSIVEIRNISRGLSLPDIEQRPLVDILQGLAEAHGARTGAEVAVDVPPGTLPEVPIAVKICCFRFVQEGLNNGWKHGEGRGQAIALRLRAQRLSLSVLDRGPGFAGLPADVSSGEDGLGLVGLADRVESLGGSIDVRNRDDGPGAALTMELDLEGAV